MYSLTRCAWQSSLRFLLCSLWRVKTSLRKISVSEAREWILYQWRCDISAWCPWSFPLRLFRPTPVSQEYLKQNDGAQKSWNVSIVTVTRQFTIRNTTYCKIDKIIRELLRSDEIMCGIWACPCITGKLNTCLVARTCYANTASDIKFCIKEHNSVHLIWLSKCHTKSSWPKNKQQGTSFHRSWCWIWLHVELDPCT